MITPIYVKTAYSFLSSLITVDDLIEFSKDNNLKALCISDDNMHGVMEFIKKCESNNIKPVVGLDLGFCLLYAKNYDGYKNLLKIATIKSKSVIKKEDLVGYNSDLICVIFNIYSEDLTYLKDLFNDLYVGFSNNDDYLIIKEKGYNPLYIKKTLCLKKSDIETLKYLLMLRDNKTLSEEYYFDSDLCIENIKEEYHCMPLKNSNKNLT